MKTSVIDVRAMLSALTVRAVEKRIGKVPGVQSVTVNDAAGNATVRYDETLLEIADIKAAVHQSEYRSAGQSRPRQARNYKPARKRSTVPTQQATPVPAAPPEATATTTATAAPVPPPAMAKAGTLDDPSVRDADEVASALGADANNGLTAQEASRRLAQDGPNELRSAPRIPAWRRFLSHFHDPLVYLLLAAVAVALVAWVIEGGVGWPVDAIVIAIVVLLNGVLGYLQEVKAQDAVAALARMTAATSAVLRDAQVRRVQEASLTGESEAVLKDAATLREPAPLGDRLNMVFKGTAIAQGTGRAVVTATCDRPGADATYFPAQCSAALNQRQTFAICKLSCNRARMCPSAQTATRGKKTIMVLAGTG